jgi:hypothetical protein
MANIKGRLRQRTSVPTYDNDQLKGGQLVTGTFTNGDTAVAVALGTGAVPGYVTGATSLLVPVTEFEWLAVMP